MTKQTTPKSNSKRTASPEDAAFLWNTAIDLKQIKSSSTFAALAEESDTENWKDL
jgi:hypothetical protein